MTEQGVINYPEWPHGEPWSARDKVDSPKELLKSTFVGAPAGFGPGGCVQTYPRPEIDTSLLDQLKDFELHLEQSLTPQERFAEDVTEVLDGIKAMLIEKNRKYGDSALSPSRTFSKSDAVEQIKVRLDDKLTRIKNQQNDEDEDVVKDLLGYLIILLVAQKRANAE